MACVIWASDNRDGVSRGVNLVSNDQDVFLTLQLHDDRL
jgi:hypothetical protein